MLQTFKILIKNISAVLSIYLSYVCHLLSHVSVYNPVALTCNFQNGLICCLYNHLNYYVNNVFEKNISK